jgi:hypothetical protein
MDSSDFSIQLRLTLSLQIHLVRLAGNSSRYSQAFTGASLFGATEKSSKAQHAWNAKVSGLETDDGLAAEAAAAKLFENLRRTVQFHRGPDARGDRPICKHTRDLAQPLRR